MDNTNKELRKIKGCTYIFWSITSFWVFFISMFILMMHQGNNNFTLAKWADDLFLILMCVSAITFGRFAYLLSVNLKEEDK